MCDVPVFTASRLGGSAILKTLAVQRVQCGVYIMALWPILLTNVLLNFQDFSHLQSGGPVSLVVVVPKLSAAGRDLLQV